MYKIGITGGVGSGKSCVLDYMREDWQAAIYQADILAHEVQEPGENCFLRIVQHFGEGILTEEGRIDRKKLGQIVFADARELRTLNEMVHPAVDQKILKLMRKEQEAGTQIFVLEAALLTEKRYRNYLDEIWYVYVTPEKRRERLKAGRGYSDERIDKMLSLQAGESVYRSCSDRVIDNNEELEVTYRSLEKAYQDMTGEID